MAQNINQNGNFHTPLSPMRFQSSMGKEVKRKYKDGKNMVRLSLARVAKVNYKYNTVDVITIQDKNNTTKNPNDNGRFSARLPVQFGGQTPDGKVFGTNTLVTVGCLVLVGFLEGHKDNPIVLNIYGDADNQSMLTRTTYTGADESDEALQQELWQLFTLYPSMTYKNIDGHGNQEVTFPGKTFFYASADDSRVNDAFFDYDHLPSSSYANGDLIEPTVPEAPNMLYVHQSIIDNHRVTFFVKSDGTVRVGSRHADGKGVTFWQLNTDGSFKIQQSNDTVDPEDKSSNFSSFSIEDDGTIALQSGENVLTLGSNGLLYNGGTINGGSIDLSNNQTIKDMQGDIYNLQQSTTTSGIIQTVTESTPWQNINDKVNTQLQNTKQTFINQPAPPYNTGDIWMNGSASYICTTPKAIGATFSLSDWELSADVTSQNTSGDTKNVNGTPSSTLTGNVSSAQNTASAAQLTAQAKSEMFLSQPTPPYNKGDVWNNNGIIYVSNITRPDGATFLMADWVKSADITANNTSADTANVNGTPSSTITSSISSNASAASSAQSTANSASSAAQTAQSTAEGKARTFTSTPVPPYSIGDMWNQSGKVYSCINPKASGTAFNSMDWVLVADMTSLNTAADTSNVNGQASSTLTATVASNTTAASNAQSLATSKAKAFITQPVPPYSVGDVWDNNSTVYICQTARSTGSFTQSDWRLSGDVTANNTSADTSNVNGTASSTVISNISSASSAASAANTLATSKAKGFITQPIPPYSVGDVWDNNGTVYVCKTARSTGSFTQSDWQLAGDVTANNTAADTSNVNGTASSTVISNISSASSAASNAQSTASAAQSTANDANTLAQSKAKGFITQPVPPYNVGDVWDNSGTVYICQTAKASGTAFSSADWVLSGDVTANNTSADTSKVNGTASSTVISNISSASSAASAAQTTANSKAQTFTAQPTIPYNLGDIYRNGSAVYVCTTARSTGSYTASDFALVGDVTSQNTAADTTNVNGTASATVISNISSASSAASNAQTTANSKAQTFTSTPVPPYNVGDIYKNGSTVYVCTTSKASGGTYASADFVLVGDVTANNTAADTSAVNGVASATVNSNISSASSAASAAQTTANSKAKTYTAQPTPPYNTGDVWQSTNAVYICTAGRASGSYTATDWYKAGDVTSANTSSDTSNVNGTASSTVISNISSASSAASTAQTTANGKAKTYTAQPAPPYNTGDIWQTTNAVYICTTGRSSGSYTASDWYKAGDVTSANTAADTSNVNGTASSTVINNISSASSAASAAQTTANSKAKTWTVQPTPPYSVGDIWQNGGSVYVCTSARASGSYTASDWYKAGDVTANNTAADVTNVNGTPASTVTTNASNGASAYSQIQNQVGTGGTIASTSYVQSSKGQNLITNGLGQLGNNTNFNSPFDGVNKPDTVTGSFKATSTGTYGFSSNEIVKVDYTRTYKLSITLKGDGSSGQTTYFGLQPFDVDGNVIDSESYMYLPNSTTTLSQALNPGDTVVHLTSVSGWVDSSAAYQRRLMFWNYKDSLGYTYPTGTYTRNRTGDNSWNYNTGAISTSANTITLNAAYSGPAIPSGTAVSQGNAGGTYLYMSNVSNLATPTTWTTYTNTYTGLSSNGAWASMCFPSGTKGVTVYGLLNYGSSVSATTWVANVQFIDVTEPNNSANTAVNNLVIGGRNYLRNTSNFVDTTNWSLSVGSNVAATLGLTTDSVYGTVLNVNVTANSATSPNNMIIQNVGLTLPSGKFTVGNTYTLSFYIINPVTMYVNFMDSSGVNAVTSNSPTIPISASWQRVVWSFTATATGNTPELYLAMADTTHTGNIYITQVQLEDGPKASGYQPAPEDIANQISTVSSNVNNVMQGVFPTGMGSAIVNTVTSASTYVSALNAKANASDLANYATGDQLTQAQSAAQSYTDQSIAGIDFSPYVTTSSMTQSNQAITSQFTASGGVNLLKNSVGHSLLDDGVTPAFWTIVSGTPSISLDPTIAHYGATSGFMLNGSSISQSVTVTPNQSYTISAIVNKGSAGTGSIKIADTSTTPISQTISLASGTTYSYQKVSVNITPATSTLTVTLTGDSTSGGVLFTCVMLNIGTQAFTWQQAIGEVYNTNVNFDLNGIRVMSTDSNGHMTAETIMTPTKFAGYSDLNGDGKIDTSTGSVDEVFRMDKDTFVMKNATIGPIKIVAVTGTHTGFAFVPNN